MSGTYYDIIQDFKELLVDYLDNIFAIHNHKMSLQLQGINVISRPGNKLESSTATGYILEEYAIAALSDYTKHKQNSKLLVLPAESAHASYDCYCIYKGIKFIINFKCAKGVNDGVAAIGKLVEDYCKSESLPKSYVVVKICYDFDGEANDRHISIKGYDTYALEEVDFSAGHKQDKRSWSGTSDLNAGRLQISDSFRRKHTAMPENVSYENTCRQLLAIRDTNLARDNQVR